MTRSGLSRRALVILGLVGLGALVFVSLAGAATKVNLQTADSFAVLAASAVTNTGPSVLNGDLGSCPALGPAITGFPPGAVNGTTHAGDAVACQAQSDLTIAYNAAAAQAPTTTFPGPTDLGGMTLTTGVFNSPSSLAITGTLTLDAQGDPNAVFIFQAGSTLITAPNSHVVLINGARPATSFGRLAARRRSGWAPPFSGPSSP